MTTTLTQTELDHDPPPSPAQTLSAPAAKRTRTARSTKTTNDAFNATPTRRSPARLDRGRHALSRTRNRELGASW